MFRWRCYGGRRAVTIQVAPPVAELLRVSEVSEHTGYEQPVSQLGHAKNI